ncbi:cysteine--tRNA ligase [Dehalococcoidia bacterium]|nr:cysteine--tRNA ligase [Dehalococcoidia bacterium]
MKIYNPISGQKEAFVPGGDEVKMYVCGVTPYDSCHIGHAMSYVIFDVVRRYLEFRGYKVRHVQNFTDIDDKIIARANELGIPAHELTGRLIDEYFEDMDALNVKRADIYPRASEEIPDIVRTVQGLIEKGHAYEVSGDVYFRVRSAAGYGKLSRRDLDEMSVGARVEVDQAKEYPLDFALWKAAKPGEPSWESPWGRGRPGWHIECSAMAIKYLGKTLDIHGGGQDLIFPHHENEIAQSEAFTGAVPFVRYWMHNGLLQLDQDKMSKSLGNLVTVRELLQRFSADAFRLFVLSSYYRSPLSYSNEGLAAMEKGVDRLRRAAKVADDEAQGHPLDAESYRQRFVEAMDDDFNTAQAVATLFDLAREINRAREEGAPIRDARRTLRELADVLGLTLEEEVHLDAAPYIKLAMEYELASAGEEQPASYYIDRLIEKRHELRRARDWANADKIRDSLAEMGTMLEDTPQGTKWRQER